MSPPVSPGSPGPSEAVGEVVVSASTSATVVVGAAAAGAATEAVGGNVVVASSLTTAAGVNWVQQDDAEGSKVRDVPL